VIFYPFRIPDPEVKKTPDPGSATLYPTYRYCILKPLLSGMKREGRGWFHSNFLDLVHLCPFFKGQFKKESALFLICKNRFQHLGFKKSMCSDVAQDTKKSVPRSSLAVKPTGRSTAPLPAPLSEPGSVMTNDRVYRYLTEMITWQVQTGKNNAKCCCRLVIFSP
jgi:hypothetical protein